MLKCGSALRLARVAACSSLAMIAAGCSFKANAAPDAGPANPAKLGDAGGCAPKQVWHGNAFDLSGDSPLNKPPPEDGGCFSVATEYDFLLDEKTLAGRICSLDGPEDRTVSLTDAQILQITSQALSLTTSCSSAVGPCSATFGEQEFDDEYLGNGFGDGIPYYSDFFAGCFGASGPYVSYHALSDLESLLHSIVFPAEADAGGE
jgi:hypothetical protein